MLLKNILLQNFSLLFNIKFFKKYEEKKKQKKEV